MKVIAVIPARLNSKRFKGKVLYPFNEKPLLFYVWQPLMKAKEIDRVIIATDDKSIRKTAENFGAEVITTSKKHKTGTDRLAEIAKKIKGDIYINFQADNFGLKPKIIDKIITDFKNDKNAQCATLVKPITQDELLFDPNHVKVIFNKDNKALWFSRYPLPFLQNADNNQRTKQFQFYGHIGIYLFRKKVLTQFSKLNRTIYEKAESLEQLRLLENGIDIKIYKTKMKTVSIDCLEDLKKITKLS